MKKTYEEFLKMVKTECKKHKVKLDLRRGKYLRLNGFRCGGFFDSDVPVLAAAMGHRDSKILLAHEYCHMTQWLDNFYLWEKSPDSMEKIEAWLNGAEVEDIAEQIKISRDLELDNEMRTTKLVEEYDLGIEVGEYIKKCNAYVLFYNWLLESRRWSKPGNSPYVNPKVLEVMSDKFDMNYDSLSPEIAKVFREQNI